MSKRADIPPRTELNDLYWNELKSLNELGKHYDVSRMTVSVWFDKYGIKKRPPHSYARVRRGKKRCGGILHNGEMVSTSEFWIFKTGKRKGKLFSQCRHCLNVSRFGDLDHGLVPIRSLKFVFVELEARIGRAETARRLGWSVNIWYKLDHKTNEKILVRKAKQAILLLIEIREEKEVRHKKSIRHGSKSRGHEERTPRHPHEFNGPNNQDAVYSKAKRERDKDV